MSVLTTEQKQENILAQYALAPDYENEINESIKTLKDLESILEIFQDQKNQHLILV
jgi:hypothetical protein